MRPAWAALLLLGCGGGTFTAEEGGGSAGVTGAGAGLGGSSGESPQGDAGEESGGSPAGQGGMVATAGGGAGAASGGPATGGAGTGGESATGGLPGAGAGQGGSAGSAGDAPVAGTGGSAGEAPVCGRNVGSTAERFIDDLEDGDNVIGNGENENDPPTRVGTWFRFRGEQVPCEGSPTPLVPDEDTESAFAAHLAGGGCGVLGLDLNRCGETTKNYDVTAYEGLTLRYRSAYPIRVMVVTRANLPAAEGGECTDDYCGNHHGKNFDAAPDWADATVTWADLAGDQSIGSPASPPQTFGEARPFRTDEVLGITIETSAADQDFDLWLDDLRFL